MDNQLEIIRITSRQDELRKKAVVAHKIFLVIFCISIFIYLRFYDPTADYINRQ